MTLDVWVVMPNHLHGIVIIHDESSSRIRTGGSRTAPTVTAPTSTAPTTSAPAPTDHISTDIARVGRKPLGRLVGAFKTVSTKRINGLRGTPGMPFWQRNYWEHVIRNDASLQRIRRYVDTNPALWADDQLYPDAPPNPFNRPYRERSLPQPTIPTSSLPQTAPTDVAPQLTA